MEGTNSIYLVYSSKKNSFRLGVTGNVQDKFRYYEKKNFIRFWYITNKNAYVIEAILKVIFEIRGHNNKNGLYKIPNTGGIVGVYEVFEDVVNKFINMVKDIEEQYPGNEIISKFRKINEECVRLNKCVDVNDQQEVFKLYRELVTNYLKKEQCE